MLIALFVPSLRGGGAERVVVTLANALVQRGFKVDILLVKAVGPYLFEVSSAVNVIDFGRSRVLFSIVDLVRYLRSRKPTTLCSFMRHSNLVALLAKKISGGNARLVVSERSDGLAEIRQKKQHFFLPVKFVVRYLYLSADAIHAVSCGVAESCAKELNLRLDSIRVVYNPVVTQRLLAMSYAKVDFSWLPKDGRPLILAVGRLSQQKDFATLIKAFALVSLKINAQLLILGDGNLRSDLDLLIADHNLQQSILMPGFVDNPIALMRLADVFVLSSAWEGLPNVLIQAMACGTPVVSTNCRSGPDEILENGKWGRLVQVGDVKSLHHAILDTLVDKNLPDVATRASDFSLQRTVDEYLRLLLPDVNQ